MIEKISYEEVSAISQQFKSSASKLREIFNSVDSQISRINTEDVWKSNAASELYQKFRNLSGKFESFEQEIMAYSNFLDKTVETYRQADLNIARSAEELQS